MRMKYKFTLKFLALIEPKIIKLLLKAQNGFQSASERLTYKTMYRLRSLTVHKVYAKILAFYLK